MEYENLLLKYGLEEEIIFTGGSSTHKAIQENTGAQRERE